MEPLKDHQYPTEPEQLAQFIAAEERPLLFTVGQYAPDPEQEEKYFLWAVRDDSLQQLGEFWLTKETVSRLKAKQFSASKLKWGECNAMYRTPPGFCWYLGEGEFLLYRNEKEIMRIKQEKITLSGIPDIPAELTTGMIEKIFCFISSNWVHRGVSLHLRGGTKITIAEEEDQFPLLDFTYGGLELMADTAWVHSLSRILKQALGVPVEMDEDLK